MDAVRATDAKYIKLGEKGTWEHQCIEDGTLRLGYRYVPHDLSVSGDFEGVRQHFLGRGFKAGIATNHANQVRDFYTATNDTMWITFSAGSLWWAIADGPVEYLGGSEEEINQRGSRLRRTVDGWHNTSVGGASLRMAELNGALTRTSAFRMTICNVEQFDYLIRKVNDQDLPQVTHAKAAQADILQAIMGLMSLLTWRDFELLVELIFGQSGWRRVSASGGTQKTIDIELVLPTTGETAFVQVKSQTDQAQLNKYINEFGERDDGRMFYVYHNARAPLRCTDERVVLIGPDRLAAMVLDAGLFDWLLKKAG
jgi:hypothetical protein